MKDTMFYEQLLGLKSPWSVKKVDLSMADKRVTVEGIDDLPPPSASRIGGRIGEQRIAVLVLPVGPDHNSLAVAFDTHSRRGFMDALAEIFAQQGRRLDERGQVLLEAAGKRVADRSGDDDIAQRLVFSQGG